MTYFVKHHQKYDKERWVAVVDFDNSAVRLAAVLAVAAAAAGCGWCFCSSDARSLPLPIEW